MFKILRLASERTNYLEMLSTPSRERESAVVFNIIRLKKKTRRINSFTQVT